MPGPEVIKVKTREIQIGGHVLFFLKNKWLFLSVMVHQSKHIFPVNILSCDIWFPTAWHFDKCRLI